MIYTSGSTGFPKGVVIEHRGLLNYLQWCLETYPYDCGTATLLHTPLSFDLTVTSLFPPLVTGNTVEIIAETPGIEGLKQALLTGNRYSVLKITPAHLQLLAAELEREDRQREQRQSQLRSQKEDQQPDQSENQLDNQAEKEAERSAKSGIGALVIGGEELRRGMLRYWRREYPQTRLFNEYGPTETVVGSSVYEVRQTAVAEATNEEAASQETANKENEETERRAESRGVAIGQAITNQRVYILDGDW